MIRPTSPIRRAALCFALATLLLSVRVDAQSASAQSAAADSQSSFRISGTFINEVTGSPLDRTRVTLVDTTNQATRWSVVTTENGHFAFTALPRGKFSLFAARRGFLRAFYQQHEQFSTAIVTGPALDSENLLLKLIPLATLSGKVLDESGEGVRGAAVILYGQIHRGGVNRVQPVNSDMTDDEGYYEFAALAPGDYFLSAGAKPWYAVHNISSAARRGNPPVGVPSYLDVAYPTTYYNGATDSQAASPIAVHGGDRMQVDMHLYPVPVLHLVVRGPADAQQEIYIAALMKHAFDAFESPVGDGMQEISPGIYEITGVPEGKYIVQMRGRQNGQMTQPTEVNLTRDGQELNIAQLEPAATLRFLVEIPRQGPMPKLTVGLQDSRGALYGFDPVDDSGHVTIEGVSRGKYAIMVGGFDKRYSVTRAISAGVELSPSEFTVTPGSSQEVTLYLSAGVVSVEGFVKRGNKPVSGVMVALIPKNPQAHLDMFRRDQSDSDGSFIVRGVIPGSYTLVAVEDALGLRLESACSPRPLHPARPKSDRRPADDPNRASPGTGSSPTALDSFSLVLTNYPGGASPMIH
jgi:hypothetical protein